MNFYICIVFAIFSTICASSDHSSGHELELPASPMHSAALNSNLKGLTLQEYLAESETHTDWSQLTKPVPSTPVISSCSAFIDYFGQVSANFTKCVVSFARPLRVCEHCIEEFLRAKSAFDLVMKGRHKDKQEVDCGDLILNSDRVQIIVRTFNFIRGIWDDCNCQNCFDFMEAGHNGTIHYKLSNKTIRFHELAVETLKCFENNTWVMPANNHTHKNTSAVCVNCAHVYNEINELYETLQTNQHHKVCMDIVDTINTTRLNWSKTFSCSLKHVDATPVFIISGLFCLLPIFFYLGNCIYVTRTQNENQKPTGPEDQTETDGNETS